ncbi:hypothetical protein [Kandleria vitulina]|jgi:hypothetical protein|uniref:hypothetical protein n=1 Tax=Kandleria vitulina TaxID=1630 RepID=UPI00048DD75E|nr:hypothetical protein [Kandleria vitulina]
MKIVKENRKGILISYNNPKTITKMLSLEYIDLNHKEVSSHLKNILSVDSKVIIYYKEYICIFGYIKETEIRKYGDRFGYKLYNVNSLIRKSNESERKYPFKTISEYELNLEIEKMKKYSERDKSSKLSNNVFDLVNAPDVVSEIQLISGSNNHVTRGHPVNNSVKKIIYRNKGTKKFGLQKVTLHYCAKCNVFFDFSESFYEQLRRNAIPRKEVYATFYNNRMHEIEIYQEMNLRQESRLHSLGYNVGVHGLTRYGRQHLLKKIIRYHLMSAAQVKSHLQFLINFNGRSSNNFVAASNWEEDMQFINGLISKGIK